MSAAVLLEPFRASFPWCSLSLSTPIGLLEPFRFFPVVLLEPFHASWVLFYAMPVASLRMQAALTGAHKLSEAGPLAASMHTQGGGRAPCFITE